MNRKTEYKTAAQIAGALTGDREIEADIAATSEESHVVKALIKLRIQKGVSQKAMAEKLGCSPSRICRMESGTDEQIRVTDLRAYCRTLGITPHIVLDDETLPRATRVKWCVLTAQKSLNELAALAREMESEPEVVDKIHQFFGEVLFNFITRFVENQESLPPVIPSPHGQTVIELEEDENNESGESEPDKVVRSEA